ncbi:MAG: hypothetical protein KGZ74_06860 [Chitinophagaceae bacterium]|jgi:hypothetical protein|nr:hypothetical protein [Chitinophagaceae bacterium]
MNKSDKIFNWLNTKIGLTNALVLLLFITLLAYEYNKRIDLDRKQATTLGISVGVKKISKGSRYIFYEFRVDGKLYHGLMPEEFCFKSNKRFCDSGETVYVKFQYDNPDNNTLIEKEP